MMIDYSRNYHALLISIESTFRNPPRGVSEVEASVSAMSGEGEKKGTTAVSRVEMNKSSMTFCSSLPVCAKSGHCVKQHQPSACGCTEEVDEPH